MTGGLVELPVALAVVANVALWAVWSVAVGYVMHRRPAAAFARDGALTRPRAFERGGRWYERRLHIRWWKDRLPEAGAVFSGGFSKRRVPGRARDLLERFVAETRRAELTHWYVMAIVPVFVVWNPWWAMIVHVAYALAANGPCLVVQRYNRARLLRTLHRRAADGPRTGGRP